MGMDLEIFICIFVLQTVRIPLGLVRKEGVYREVVFLRHVMYLSLLGLRREGGLTLSKQILLPKSFK